MACPMWAYLCHGFDDSHEIDGKKRSYHTSNCGITHRMRVEI